MHKGWLAGFCVALSAGAAQADVTHVVARGHTIDAISRRYHVPSKVIMDVNHIKDPRHLRVGQSLLIPGVAPPPSKPGTVPTAKPTTPLGGHAAPLSPSAKPGAKVVVAPTVKPPIYASRPTTPGVVHVKRLATNEDTAVRVTDRRGRVPPTAIKSLEHLMRSGGGTVHPIDARLIALLGVMSNHFGSRKIEIVSGFRPYSPTQYTQHSNHNIGHAVDFHVVGVPNEVVRDFCRTIKNAGCGYYPNSTFVHMDTRAASAYWIDYSKPGEPPKYNAPNLGADETTSEVANEIHTFAPVEPPTIQVDLGAIAPTISTPTSP